jgi:hypothetical protein
VHDEPTALFLDSNLAQILQRVKKPLEGFDLIRDKILVEVMC